MKMPFLATPSWTQTSQGVLSNIVQDTIHCPGENLETLLERTTESLRRIFQTQNEVLTLPGGETGALEGAVVNFFSPRDKVVSGIMGENGSQWAEIAERFGLQVLRLGSKRGETITAWDVELLLRSEAGKEIKGVFITHNEISTGVVTDIRKIGEVCQKYRLLFLVDAINSLGVIDLKTDEWGVDVAVSSLKNLIVPAPCLSFFSVSDKAREYNAKARCPRYYWDLSRTQKYFHHHLIPEKFPIPVELLYNLDEALQVIKKEGLENIFARYRKLSQMLRRGLEALGLELLVKDEYIASPSVTVIKVPESVEAEKIISFSRKEGIAITGGDRELSGKIVRVEHSDYCAFDIANTIATLGRAFQAQGVAMNLGKGLSQAWEVYDNG